jgi:hypothetical protein
MTRVIMCNMCHDEALFGVFWVLCDIWCFWCVSTVVCQHINMICVSSVVGQHISMICVSSVVWVLCYVWCLQQCGCAVLCKTLRQVSISCNGYLESGILSFPTCCHSLFRFLLCIK